jgi:hypothetical protein
MSMSREAQKYHEQYEAAPETIRWAVDNAYDEVAGICKAAGLPISRCDAGETLVADIFKFIIASKIEQEGWAASNSPKPLPVVVENIPVPNRIETKSYYAEPLGGSWTVRYKSTGEVVCFRPGHMEAEQAMESMESRGTLA